jgi:serine/threonine protein kinase
VTDSQREGYLTIVEGRSDIDGRFKDIRRISPSGGCGVFSLVFRGVDSTNGRPVAIKVFRPDKVDDSYRYQSFLREAAIGESLRGQHDIAEYLCKAGEFNQLLTTETGISVTLRFPYLALELASHDVGYVLEKKLWGPEQILIGFRTMCRAVQRIHSRRICHRDLKPSNFLVLDNGEVRLSDFGTARDLGGDLPAVLPAYAGPPGDVRYTAPEMLALLHDDDPEIAFIGDFFALGAILFELCTGTNLGVLISTPQFRANLALTMAGSKKGERRANYDKYVARMAHAQSLPDVGTFATSVPSSIRSRVNGLYKTMAAIDYRKRSQNFDRVFLKIDQILIVLRNHEKYRRWREQREWAKSRREANRLQRDSDYRNARG